MTNTEKPGFDFEEQAWCTECEQVVEEPEPCYECSSCGSSFSRSNSADGMSHRCPDCNKFGAKTTERGCPDCQSEVVTEMVGECPDCGETLFEASLVDGLCPNCGNKTEEAEVTK